MLWADTFPDYTAMKAVLSPSSAAPTSPSSAGGAGMGAGTGAGDVGSPGFSSLLLRASPLGGIPVPVFAEAGPPAGLGSALEPVPCSSPLTPSVVVAQVLPTPGATIPAPVAAPAPPVPSPLPSPLRGTAPEALPAVPALPPAVDVLTGTPSASPAPEAPAAAGEPVVVVAASASSTAATEVASVSDDTISSASHLSDVKF
jgi:hypothetical protein